MHDEAAARISVIIPTYNRAQFLREAIRSVKAQTYTNYELIVVDDGSTDDTPQVCRDEQVTYIPIFHCGLPGQVRNVGALQATGEWLAFLDADDLWLESKLAKQLAYFKENPAIMLCHTREIWQRGEKIVSQASQRQQRSGQILPDALKKCIIGPSTVMLKRQLFKDVGMFNPGLEIAEDYELWLRICAHYPVGYIDEPLIIKRGGHADQLSAKYGQIEVFRIAALLLNIKLNTFRGADLFLAQEELQKKCLIHAQGCQKRGKPDEAARYFALAEEYAHA